MFVMLEKFLDWLFGFDKVATKEDVAALRKALEDLEADVRKKFSYHRSAGD